MNNIKFNRNERATQSILISMLIIVAAFLVVIIFIMTHAHTTAIISPQNINLVLLNVPTNAITLNFLDNSITVNGNATIEVQTQGNITFFANGKSIPVAGSYHYLIYGMQDRTIYIKQGSYVEFVEVNVNKYGFNDFAITNDITPYANNINLTKTSPPEYISPELPPPDYSNANAPVYHYSYLIFNATNPGTYYYFSTVYPDLFYGMEGMIIVGS